jgi:hypothetical protein
VLAAAGGVVLSVEHHAEYGTLLTLDHGNHLLTRYAHLSRVDVQVGDIVRRRQPVAAVGSTGRSTGPHLHFEVLVQGVPQNPARFLAAKAGPRVMIPKILTQIFGSRNDRLLKTYRATCQINALEPQFEALDDAALQAKTDEFRSAWPAASTLDAAARGLRRRCARPASAC